MPRPPATESSEVIILNNRASMLLEAGQLPEAVEALDRALALDPECVPALYNRGTAFRALSRLEEAQADLAKARLLMPDAGSVASEYFYVSALLCDWKESRGVQDEFSRRVRAGQNLHPWQVIFASDDPETQLQAARQFAIPARRAAPRPTDARRERLRIAYLSPDFREHPIGFQMVELFERHDRARFETFGVSLYPTEDSTLRRRLIGSFDHFAEVRTRSDADIAQLLIASQIDIAVDLAGYSSMGRTKLLSLRPAPIAVSYCGYPGTLGTDYIDYILADDHVVPHDAEHFYTERVVRLPGSFFPTDTTRGAAERPTRAEAGLPEQGFVFCTFNNSKFTPQMFDIWMRLLQQVEGSVLWMSATNAVAQANLCAEAKARDIPRERLVFAERIDRARYFERLSIADLFLDTLPYNAHTTASDALWAGVPVITCSGQGFAARVAGSQLAAIGMPELIATNLADYETLALELARSPERLAAIRAKLSRNRASHPLFNTAKLCRAIESAYETMWDIWQRGEAPRSFSVSETDAK